jgi:hypothetical protein
LLLLLKACQAAINAFHIEGLMVGKGGLPQLKLRGTRLWFFTLHRLQAGTPKTIDESHETARKEHPQIAQITQPRWDALQSEPQKSKLA